MSQVCAFWAPPCRSTSSGAPMPQRSALSRAPPPTSTATRSHDRRLAAARCRTPRRSRGRARTRRTPVSVTGSVDRIATLGRKVSRWAALAWPRARARPGAPRCATPAVSCRTAIATARDREPLRRAGRAGARAPRVPRRRGPRAATSRVAGSDDRGEPAPGRVVAQLRVIGEARAGPVEVLERPSEARPHRLERGPARPALELTPRGWRAAGERRAELDDGVRRRATRSCRR